MSSWEGENDLGFELSRLRQEVEDLMTAVEYLPVRMNGLDNQMSDVRRSMRQVEARAADAETTTRDLAALIKRLDARVEWLERNIRLTDQMPVVELDDVDPDLEHLSDVAEAGHVAAAGLLDAATRSGLEAAVAAHADAIRSRAHHLSSALGASRSLADTAYTEPAHREAAADFRSCLDALEVAERRAKELAPDALEAADQLSADDGRRLAKADVIAAGEGAWRALQARLRVRIADAVGEGALLPTWFTRVLGPIPPAEDTRAWMDAATTLLAYRVTYGVNDPIAALGPEPGDRDTSRRRVWHHQLRRQLRELQR